MLNYIHYITQFQIYNPSTIKQQKQSESDLIKNKKKYKIKSKRTSLNIPHGRTKMHIPSSQIQQTKNDNPQKNTYL